MQCKINICHFSLFFYLFLETKLKFMRLVKIENMIGQMRFIRSPRGKTMLEVDGQPFTLNQRKGETFYWECVKKKTKSIKCNSRIITYDGAIKAQRGAHNHM